MRANRQGTLRFWATALVAGGTGLIMSAGPARSDAGWPALAVLLVHTGAGFWLLATGLALGPCLLKPAAGTERRPAAALLLLAIALATGAGAIWIAAAGSPVDRYPALGIVHGAAGVLGTAAAAALLGGLGRRSAAEGAGEPAGSSEAAAERRTSGRARRPSAGLVAGVAVGLVILIGAWPIVSTVAGGSSPPGYDSRVYYDAVTAARTEQSASPYFPATAWLPTAADEVACDAQACHPRQWREWQASSHVGSARSARYLDALRYFARTSPDGDAGYCRSCHGTAPSAGVGCVGCHGIREVPMPMGNGWCRREPVPPPPAAANSSPLGYLTQLLTRLRPGPHRRDLTPGALLRSARSCAPCHRQSLTVAQNRYKFLRGPDLYGTWQRSSLSGNSIHGFAPVSAEPQDCRSCHMPRRAGGGSDHSSPAWERPPGREPGPVQVTLFLLGAGEDGGRSRAGAAGLPAVMGAGPVLLPAGASVLLGVVVTNRGVGHEWPGGKAGETWLELEGRSASADHRLLFASGAAGEAGRRAFPTHTYGRVALDRAGRPVVEVRLHEMVTMLSQRVLQPGESDVARYRLALPRGRRGPVEIRARVLSRPVGGTFHAQAGDVAAGPAAGPRVVATASARLVIGDRFGFPGPGSAPARTGPGSRGEDPRGDLAVGLLLQGDLPGAESAVRSIISQAPGSRQALLIRGRIYLEEGDLLAAQSAFQQAEHLQDDAGVSPDPRPEAWLGRVQLRRGDFEAALRLLEPLAGRYPADVQLQSDIGRAHYRSGRNAEAAAAFRRVLDLDPDDAAAHYDLMRCWLRLNQLAEARREEVIYQYLKEDEAARQIVGRYLAVPGNRTTEARPIHEHVLTFWAGS